MHDAGGNRSETLAALPIIIRDLRAKGYTMVTVPKLVMDNPPPTNQNVDGLSGSGGWQPVLRPHDRLDESGRHVVDVARHRDPGRGAGSGTHLLDVDSHRLLGLEHRRLEQSVRGDADALGIARAEPGIGERAGSALVVVDDRHLEQRPLRTRHLGHLADEGDVARTSSVTRPPALRTIAASPSSSPSTARGRPAGRGR